MIEISLPCPSGAGDAACSNRAMQLGARRSKTVRHGVMMACPSVHCQKVTRPAASRRSRGSSVTSPRPIREGKCTAARVWEVLAGGGGGDDPPTEATTQSLVAAAESGAGAELVKEFTKTQGTIWQGLSLAHTYLATIGLIYPSPDELVTPLFGQFTSTPTGGAGIWPHREPADEFDSYIYSPNTPIEQPATGSPMSSGMSPSGLVENLPNWIGELIPWSSS